MDKIPKRSKLAKIYRDVLDKYENRLVFPVKDPNFYQFISIFLSTVFLFKPGIVLGIVLLTIILISDWMDGAVARKYGLTSREGWMIDVVIDRLSEALIFVGYLGTVVGKIFFGAYLLNIVLSFYAVRTGKHLLIATRFFYLIYLLVVLIIKYT